MSKAKKQTVITKMRTSLLSRRKFALTAFVLGPAAIVVAACQPQAGNSSATIEVLKNSVLNQLPKVIKKDQLPLAIENDLTPKPETVVIATGNEGPLIISVGRFGEWALGEVSVEESDQNLKLFLRKKPDETQWKLLLALEDGEKLLETGRKFTAVDTTLAGDGTYPMVNLVEIGTEGGKFVFTVFSDDGSGIRGTSDIFPEQWLSGKAIAAKQKGLEPAVTSTPQPESIAGRYEVIEGRLYFDNGSIRQDLGLDASRVEITTDDLAINVYAGDQLIGQVDDSMQGVVLKDEGLWTMTGSGFVPLMELTGVLTKKETQVPATKLEMDGFGWVNVHDDTGISGVVSRHENNGPIYYDVPNGIMAINHTVYQLKGKAFEFIGEQSPDVLVETEPVNELDQNLVTEVQGMVAAFSQGAGGNYEIARWVKNKSNGRVGVWLSNEQRHPGDMLFGWVYQTEYGNFLFLSPTSTSQLMEENGLLDLREKKQALGWEFSDEFVSRYMQYVANVKEAGDQDKHFNSAAEMDTYVGNDSKVPTTRINVITSGFISGHGPTNGYEKSGFGGFTTRTVENGDNVAVDNSFIGRDTVEKWSFLNARSLSLKDHYVLPFNESMLITFQQGPLDVNMLRAVKKIVDDRNLIREYDGWDFIWYRSSNLRRLGFLSRLVVECGEVRLCDYGGYVQHENGGVNEIDKIGVKNVYDAFLKFFNHFGASDTYKAGVVVYQ
jgi:hypothetical protein